MAASGGHIDVIKFLNSKEVDIGALDKVSQVMIILID